MQGNKIVSYGEPFYVSGIQYYLELSDIPEPCTFWEERLDLQLVRYIDGVKLGYFSEITECEIRMIASDANGDYITCDECSDPERYPYQAGFYNEMKDRIISAILTN